MINKRCLDCGFTKEYLREGISANRCEKCNSINLWSDILFQTVTDKKEMKNGE